MQVHYGLFTEWVFATGGLHKVPESAKHAWLALVVVRDYLPQLRLSSRIANRMALQVFWVLYTLGMAFIPRQLKQESLLRSKGRGEEVNTVSNNSTA